MFRPPVIWILLFFNASIFCQCPTVETLSERLAEVTESPVVDDCLSLLDSLSVAYHGLSVYHWNLGNSGLAILYGEKELETQQALYAGRSPELPLGKTLFNLGVFSQRKEDWRASLEYFTRAISAFREIDHPDASRRRLNSYFRAAAVLKPLGDFAKARAYYTLIIEDPAVANYPQNLAAAYWGLGELQTDLQAYDSAISNLREAAKIKRALGELNLERSILISVANALYKKGAYAEAQQLLDTQLPALPKDNLFELNRATSLGVLIQAKAGNHPAAEALYQENLRIAAIDGGAEVSAQAYDNGAEISLAKGDYAEARNRVLLAIKQVIPNFNPSAEQSVPSLRQMGEATQKLILLTLLGDLSRASELGGDKPEAIEALVAAANLTDLIVKDVGSTAPKLFWRNEVKPIYERAIRLCLETNQPERSFEFFERSRAILLYESLLENDRRSALPDSVNQQLRVYSDSLTRVEYALRNAGGKGLLTKKILYQDSLSAYRQFVIDRYPNTLRATTDVRAVKLDRATENLSNHSIGGSIQYFYGKERVYAFVNTVGKYELVDLGEANEIAARIRSWLAYFANSNAITDDPDGFRSIGLQLYQQLLPAGIASLADQLLIVPDGILAYLPFAALPTTNGGEKPEYLVSKGLFYAQSATVFEYMLAKPESEDLSVLGFAPFTEAQASGAPILLSSVAEMDILSDRFDATTLLSAAATKETIFAGLASANLVHLATHAYASRSAEEDPRILTSDDPIYLNDIYGLTADHRLITLSACNSNLGEDASGEGVLSLGRAFTAAGATGVVASLWALNDRSTAKVMDVFYGELARGASKPAALQSAQLAYANDATIPAYLRTPYYWGALTYYGAPTAVQSGSSLRWLLYSGVAVMLLLSLWWVIQSQSRK